MIKSYEKVSLRKKLLGLPTVLPTGAWVINSTLEQVRKHAKRLSVTLETSEQMGHAIHVTVRGEFCRLQAFSHQLDRVDAMIIPS
jgi:hypothetical protein